MTTPNDISQSFDQHFLNMLEYHLSRALANSDDNKLKYLWCDGILLPDDNSQLSKQNIINTRQIITRAWIGWLGTTKQDLFKMIILLGECSVDKGLTDQNLQNCLCENDTTDWIVINDVEKLIQIQLK
ncbi:MAG: hypothetical protein ACTHNW_11645 [Mucilaginibacter sp.]